MKAKYAANTRTRKWGRGIFFFSLLGVATGISYPLITGDVASGVLIAVTYAGLVGLGFYLWTSDVPSDYFEKRSIAKKVQADGQIQSALARLDESSGVKAVLAFEYLEGLVRKSYKQESGPKLRELLTSIEFDSTRVESKYIGAVTNLGAGIFSSGTASQVRIYKDWVIAGALGYDFDVSTRGEVTVDGSIQYGKNNQKIDNRKASLHLATQDWSHSFSILPDQADEARRLLNQLTAIVEQLKPKAVSSADIAEMMEKLMNAAGKSPAEKLEELSNLRYQRLLSDKEFELAKEKILGI
jgi:hypothetical protein